MTRRTYLKNRSGAGSEFDILAVIAQLAELLAPLLG
jgi:hypothetical protein